MIFRSLVEPVFLLFAFGFVGLLIVGSILGVVSAVRLHKVERATAELAEKVARLEAEPDTSVGEVAPLARSGQPTPNGVRPKGTPNPDCLAAMPRWWPVSAMFMF